MYVEIRAFECMYLVISQAASNMFFSLYSSNRRTISTFYTNTTVNTDAILFAS